MHGGGGWGACVVAGGMHGGGGHAWWGVCMVVGGMSGGWEHAWWWGGAWDTRYGQ